MVDIDRVIQWLQSRQGVDIVVSDMDQFIADFRRDMGDTEGDKVDFLETVRQFGEHLKKDFCAPDRGNHIFAIARDTEGTQLVMLGNYKLLGASLAQVMGSDDDVKTMVKAATWANKAVDAMANLLSGNADTLEKKLKSMLGLDDTD